MKDIVILGASYFSREIYSMVIDCIADGADWQLKGFLDNRKYLLDDFPHEGDMLGSVEEYKPLKNDLIIPALGNPEMRHKYVEILRSKGACFGSLIHPSVYVGKNVDVGVGCVIMQSAILTAGLTIGNFVNIGVVTTLSHGNIVGDFSQLAGYCSVTGEVRFGQFVECGCSVSIVPHTVIGDHAMLCAGSVIVRDVEPYAKVMGNPARVIGRSDESL